jgi:hypothetical protein
MITELATYSRRLSEPFHNHGPNEVKQLKIKVTQTELNPNCRDISSPMALLQDTLDKLSPPGKRIRTFCSLQMYDAFEEFTEDQHKSYAHDLINAVRAQDIDALRKWKLNGRSLQAANRFGESLLHMACRRGFTNVVKFFIDEAGLNLWIRDDFGRTPLHDACWTSDPAPDLVKYIIDKEPDMLFVSDKRGHTPLDYVRREHWKIWIDFLEGMDMIGLLPQREYFYIDTSKMKCQEESQIEMIDEMMSELKLTL